MVIVYLDVDDEITSAASRMRTTEETKLALVLPAGSRLGTSRINFRLLAREAQANAKNLAIVSPEASTRALAASAGLPVFASVFEYEAAVVPGAADAATAAPSGATTAVMVGAVEAETTMSPPLSTSGSTPVVAAATGVPAAAAGPGESAPARPPPSLPVVGGRGRRAVPRTGLIAGLAIVGLVAVVLGVAGYLLLPSATIEVVVRPEALGPVDLSVVADPAVTAADAASGVVPAERPTFSLVASGTFLATGKKVTKTNATGAVRWQNCDPTRSYRIPGGTVVRTAGGIGFAIAETVFLPVALLAGNPPSISCQSRDVAITASAAGEAGNVAAGTITVVPAAYNSVVIRVANPAPTSGGTRTETLLVGQKDVDAAMKRLTAQLDSQLAAALSDPTKVPAGRSVFDDTASRTDPVPNVDPATLVGQEVDTFDLGSTAIGSVTAVDLGAVRSIAEQRLSESVPPGTELVPKSVRVDLGEPTLEGGTVTFPVTAGAQVVRQVDEAEVRAAVVGKSAEAARQALAGFGEATISVWPSWVTTIPTYDFRLDVTVRTEVPAGTTPPGGLSAPSPTGSGAP